MLEQRIAIKHKKCIISPMNGIFRKMATRVSLIVGRSIVFFLALTVVLVWLFSGPMFDFSDTWQLVINTGTTIITFLMVFLIQNTQNRDAKAVQLKLDEIIRASKARDEFVDLENLTDEEIKELDEEFKKLHEKAAINSPAFKKLHDRIRRRSEAKKSTLQDIKEKLST